MPAALQVEEVRKELIRRNPRFDGKVEHEIEDDVVTRFKIVSDQVTDIAPIRVFSALRWLAYIGTGTNQKANEQLKDLTPLELMTLESDPRWPAFIEKVKAAMQARTSATIRKTHQIADCSACTPARKSSNGVQSPRSFGCQNRLGPTHRMHFGLIACPRR